MIPSSEDDASREQGILGAVAPSGVGRVGMAEQFEVLRRLDDAAGVGSADGSFVGQLGDVHEALALLSATIEATADGLLVVDDIGRIRLFNAQFARMWRIPDDVLSAKDDDKALGFVLDQLADPDSFLAKVHELYATPAAESFDILEFKDGRVFELEASARERSNRRPGVELPRCVRAQAAGAGAPPPGVP